MVMKKILSLILVLITLLALASCGSTKEEEKIGKDTYFGQLKELSVKIDGKELNVPMDYFDLVTTFNFSAHEVYAEDKY